MQLSMRRFSRATLFVISLIVAWVGFYGWLAVRRHQAHQSAAMDLGYTDQVVWNTLHGRLFEFSTLENAPINLPLDTFARTDNLLAYHAELLLAPISLTYLLHTGPETLLILQAVIIALGALPAYWLACKRLHSELAGVAFAAVYLMAPALQGAVLSDFHAVALTASLLLWAFFFFDTNQRAAYFVCIITAMLTKEDIPAVIALMGLGILISRKEQRTVGLATLALGAGWFVIANQVILPAFSGLDRSPFVERIALWGQTPEASLHAAVQNPMLVVQWVFKPEILMYLGGLLSSTGFMSIFGLFFLLPAAPVLGINVFSTWNWTYSEGAHYSASIIPFIILSGIFGMGWLTDRFTRGSRARPTKETGILTGAMLLIALIHHILVGVSPIVPDFEPPRVTDHQRIGQEIMARIPPDASLSAQSDLYPHLSDRRKAYLFPAVNDAEYVIVDVAGSAYPLAADKQFQEIRAVLESGEFGVTAAQNGYLLLQRGVAGNLDSKQLGEFLSFVRPNNAAPYTPISARFGDALELIGYDYAIRPVVRTTERPATIITYWRALHPLDEDYGFQFHFTRGDGAVVNQYNGPLAATLWYPTSAWKEGEIIRIETPVLSVGRLHDVLVTVTRSADEGMGMSERLAPVVATGAGTPEIVGDGTLLKIFSFR